MSDEKDCLHKSDGDLKSNIYPEMQHSSKLRYFAVLQK